MNQIKGSPKVVVYTFNIYGSKGRAYAQVRGRISDGIERFYVHCNSLTGESQLLKLVDNNHFEATLVEGKVLEKKN